MALLLACSRGFGGVLALHFAIELVHAYDLAVQSSRNERCLFDLAALCLRDGHTVHIERAAKRAFIVRFGLYKVSQRTQFGALRGDQIALRLNDQVDGGSAELILLLLSVEGLLLQFARLGSCFHAGAILFERD